MFASWVLGSLLIASPPAADTIVDAPCRCVFDFDFDSDVDCDDADLFALAWTAGGQAPQLAECSAGAIPTASTWAILALGVAIAVAGMRILRLRQVPPCRSQ